MATNHTDRSTDADDSLASTQAYLAVGLLADVADPRSYNARDVEEAIGHLEDGRDTAPPSSEAGKRIQAALGYLAELEGDAPDEREHRIRDALAELAPVAAGIAGVHPLAKSQADRPTVPVFYTVPPAAANRAIARFKRRRERVEEGAEGKYISQPAELRELIYDEINELPVIWVGGETLGGYASRAGVESMTIDPDEIQGDDETTDE